MMATTPITITDFDNGYEGQEIVIRLNVFCTIKYSPYLIRPKGLSDITAVNANHLIGFKNVQGIWFETFRNF